MNHGNVGYLTSDYTIRLPRDVLRPISASNGSELYGLYYPSKRKLSKGVSPVKFDFMLTPIRPDYWPVAVHYKIRLKHRPGAIKALTQVIKDNEDNCQATIVHTEASRSSHRYDTWNMTVAFPNLEVSAERDENGAYPETAAAAKALKLRLEEECKKYLFKDPDDKLRRRSIRCKVNTALAFFHHYLHENNARTLNFVTLGDGKITSSDNSFQQTLLELADQNNTNPITPSFVFAEMDTTDLNLRMALLPESGESKRFIGIQANWQTAGEENQPANSVGLLNDMVSSFDQRWNVWRVNSKTLRSRDGYESGRVNFLIESNANFYDIRSVKEMLTSQYQSMATRAFCEIDFDCISMSDLFRRLNASEGGIAPWAELVVSCSQPNYDQGVAFANALRTNGFDARELWKIPGGRRGAQVIAEHIQQSKALFALVDHRMSKGDAALGVRDEVMMALGAGITVIPIAYGTHEEYDFSDLPNYFDATQGICFREIENDKYQSALGEIQRALRHSLSWMSV